jgi:hypothetical protein
MALQVAGVEKINSMDFCRASVYRMEFCRVSVYRANFVGIGTINHSLHHHYQTFDWPHGFL